MMLFDGPYQLHSSRMLRSGQVQSRELQSSPSALASTVCESPYPPSSHTTWISLQGGGQSDSEQETKWSNRRRQIPALPRFSLVRRRVGGPSSWPMAGPCLPQQQPAAPLRPWDGPGWPCPTLADPGVACPAGWLRATVSNFPSTDSLGAGTGWGGEGVHIAGPSLALAPFFPQLSPCKVPAVAAPLKPTGPRPPSRSLSRCRCLD